MAKKKTTTTVEEVEETPTVQDLLQKQEDERASKFLGEKVEKGQVVEEPTEEVKEEAPKEEPKEDTEVVEFDPVQFKKEAVEEARAAIADQLKGDTKEETKENVDEYVEFQKEFFSKNNRQPSWFEVAHFMEDKALAKLEAKQEAKLKEQEVQVTKQQEEQKQQTDQTNKYVEDTLNELYSANKLPKIQDQENPDDYGMKVRNELFSTIVKVNQERLKAQQPPKTIKEIFYEDFKMPTKQVAGVDAPVNMGRGGYSPDTDSEELDYREIAGKKNSFKKIMERAFKR